MGVLFDTRVFPVAERSEALHTALLEVSGASRVHLRHEAKSASGHLTLSQFGEATVFTAACDGVRLVRDARTASTGFDDVVAIAVHGAGTARHSTFGSQRLVRTGELMMVDLTRPFDFAWDGPGSSAAVQLPRDLLGLSVDDVRRAGSRLMQSRLRGLVSSHLQTLVRTVDDFDHSPVSTLVASTTAQLVRALLTDVSGRENGASHVTEETLATQVREYIRVHLTEPDLGPDRIAIALAVSRRQLLRTCSAAELSIEQHIIELRLQNARADLTRNERTSVASVALCWGFKDADQFSRCFTSEFGTSPGAWRRLNAGEQHTE